MTLSNRDCTPREGEAPAEPVTFMSNVHTRLCWEGEAPAEPVTRNRRSPSQQTDFQQYKPAFIDYVCPRLGRSLALPGCDRLKDEMFQALEGSTR